MNNIIKIMITALSVVLIIAAMPFTASAEAQPLGNESPFISAQFIDSANNEVDGNALSAGETYTVNLVLSDISSVAIFDLTATITDDITITQVSSIADVENSGFEYGGYKLDTDSNKFVIVISTVNNTTYTDISGSTVMVTFLVEVNNDGDFADFFQISTSRDETFIMANFEDGNEASYVHTSCEATSTDFPYLDFDMSPSSNITVTGTVGVSVDETGSAATPGVIGGATINAVDANGNVVATATSESNGKFEIVVPADAVALEISKDTCTVKRTVALSGNEVSDYPVIPVIAVDYDQSKSFNAGDKGLFKSLFAANDADADLDGSGSANAGDKGIFKYFMSGSKTPNYGDLTL